MSWPEGDWRNWYFTRDKLDETLDRVEAVRADLPPGLSLPEAALRFILACPDVSTVIPGMRRPRHVEQNLAVSEAGRSTPAGRAAPAAPLDAHVCRSLTITYSRPAPAGLYFLLCV